MSNIKELVTYKRLDRELKKLERLHNKALKSAETYDEVKLAKYTEAYNKQEKKFLESDLYNNKLEDALKTAVHECVNVFNKHITKVNELVKN